MIDSRQVVWLVGCHFGRVICFLVFKREKEKPSHKYQYLNTRQVFKFLHYSMTDIYSSTFSRISKTVSAADQIYFYNSEKSSSLAAHASGAV